VTALETPVLIVGGSLVGLSTAALLGMHGVECLAVERHSGTAIHPRAGHFQLRTIEILRSLGLEEQVRRTSEELYPPGGGINNVESLAGEEIANYFPDLNAGVAEFSPTVRLFVDQDALEPIIRSRAEELGARLSYRTELASFEQDADGVTGVLRDLESGEERTVRAQYLVAADGWRSGVRSSLGIQLRGYGLLSNSITIYFTAGWDLQPLLRDRNQGVNYVTNSALRGFFRLKRQRNGGFLVVNLIGDTSRPEIVNAYPDAPWANVAEGITTERCVELLRAAIGLPDIPVTVEDVATWQAIADSAERYQEGRVFLAGDAAHVVPPNGGFGGNTGVQDAHNLAWKLALAVRGVAGEGLLATYDDERRPIGELTVDQAYARYVNRVAPYLGLETAKPIVDDYTMEVGYRYNSAAIVPEGEASLTEHPRESRARPGSRAPHLFLERDGRELSTLDLFGKRFVLLAAPEGGAWCEAAAGLEVDAYLVGRDLGDREGRFAQAYGLEPSGAVLVRPDDFVGWRAARVEDDPRGTLRDALASLLCRKGET
jgi:2-polyprenyl-6-methoxyphenol hydroxylase-like FAD-dependent oxidoreductase